jgi:uncharacterized membrane protein
MQDLTPHVEEGGNDPMSIDVSVETAIRRPREEVARYIFDPANDPVWIGGISEARVVTDGPIGAGSRVARVASFLGKRIEYVNEIDDLEPGRRLAMHSVVSPFPMRVAYEVDDADGGVSVARVRVEGSATWFYSLAGPLLARKVRSSVEGDLRRLKQILEQA